MEEIVGLKPKLTFFICTNDRTGIPDAKPSCGPRITEATVKSLKNWIKEQGLSSKVFITRTGCLGGCNKDGGVLVTYPSGKFYKGFTTMEEIKEFIQTMLPPG